MGRRTREIRNARLDRRAKFKTPVSVPPRKIERATLLGNVRPVGSGYNGTYSWFMLTFKDGLERNGVKVQTIDYRSTHFETMRKRIEAFRPDVVFTHLSFHKVHSPEKILQFYYDMRKRHGIRFVHYLADARNEPRYGGDLSYSIDLALVGQTQNLKRFQSCWKVHTIFCPYSAMTQEEIAAPAEDLAFGSPIFLGSFNIHAERDKFLNQLRLRIPIRVIETLSVGDLRHRTPELSASAKCILGLCAGYEIEHFVDVRPWQYLGAGAFMFIRKFKGMDDLIPEDLYIPFYGFGRADVLYVVNLWRGWKERDTSAIRKRAFEFIQKHHSSRERVRQILNILEDKQSELKVFVHEL